MKTKPRSNKRVVRFNLRTFPALMIVRKGHSSPWSLNVFPSEEYAKEYFDEFLKRHDFDFKWEDYELLHVQVSLPAPKKGKKK